jgi:uncharacterized protein (DUF2147 family)
MKYIMSLSIVMFLGMVGMAQSPVGVWKNVDDTDGKEKSHIQIYEYKGKLRAKVIKLLPAATITKCDACKGPNKGKPIVGMDICWDMAKQSDGTYDDGSIVDPKTGKVYSCSFEVKGDELHVRGYMGISLIGRTQVWYKVK